MAEVLGAAEAWRLRTSGAFDPAAVSLVEMLGETGDSAVGALRDDVARRHTVAVRIHELNKPLWTVDGTRGTARRLTRRAISLDGLAKGYAERDQRDAGGPELVATVSSATRMPGQYTVTWNGRDDRGNVVEQGSYRVVIEASREHGTYQLMQQELTLAAKPVAAELPGNEEIGRARVEYRRRK